MLLRPSPANYATDRSNLGDSGELLADPPGLRWSLGTEFS
jgi:hypothetical protein